MAIDPQKARASTAEIQKLSERMGRDPASRLFVPLAEEYRKLGQLDRAIETLRGGLKIIPNYTTARVALGRLLLEKGALAEAREEFEAVLREAPENLLANKKLAEAYRALGMNARAVDVYRRLAELDPFDNESQAALKALEPVVSSAARPLAKIDEPTRPLSTRPPEPGPSEPPIEKPVEKPFDNEEEYLGSPI
ncbi:MAG: tetratricopeptide repeat protein [Nitrospirae bacterium]|nr:tetratricopeptide repeat protein [Nitrospirota bacterium]